LTVRLGDTLTPAHADALWRAAHAALDRLGGDTMLIGAYDDDGRAEPGRSARLGAFAVVAHETAADFQVGIFHCTEGFALSSERCCCVLSERRPIRFFQPPHEWWDGFMAAVDVALAPRLPAA